MPVQINSMSKQNTSLVNYFPSKDGNFHTLAVCHFFLQNNCFQNHIRTSNSLDSDQARPLSLIWVQTICKVYPQKKKAYKQLINIIKSAEIELWK